MEKEIEEKAQENKALKDEFEKERKDLKKQIKVLMENNEVLEEGKSLLFSLLFSNSCFSLL